METITSVSLCLLAKLLQQHSDIEIVRGQINASHFTDKHEAFLFTKLLTGYLEEKRQFAGDIFVDLNSQQQAKLSEVCKVDLVRMKSTDELCQMLRSEANQHKASVLCQNLVDYLAQPRSEKDILAKLNEHAEKILATVSVGGKHQKIYEEQHEAVMRFAELMQQRSDGKIASISSGFKTLDHLLLGGFTLGELLVIVGMTNDGKSMLAMQICNAFAKQGYKVAVIGLEMDATEYIERDFALQAADHLVSGMNLANLRRPGKYGISPDFEGVAMEIAKKPFIYLKAKTVSVAEIQRAAKLAVDAYGCKVVMLDHSLLPVGKPGEAQHEMVDKITKFMKTFAAENQTISVLVNQLNRGTDKTNPDVSNMAGGRGVEQQATTLLAIGRRLKPEYDNNQGGGGGFVPDPNNNNRKVSDADKIDEETRKLFVLKARGAKKGTYILTEFEGVNARFRELFPQNWNEAKEEEPDAVSFEYA